MSALEPTVFVVDDDEAIRDSLSLLLETVGLNAECYASARAFLEAYDPERSGCLVLDVRMPEMSGMELQERLVAKQAILPIIFLTGHGDVRMAVHAMRAGSVDFIQKPFGEQELLDRIQQTIEQDRKTRELLGQRDEIRRRLQSLTPRERQVMDFVAEGTANKVIAIDLGISERTVEIHRSRVMHKMGAASLPHLVRMILEVSG